jgi:hypothetical protein
MGKLDEAGWKFPTPHEVLGVVVVLLAAAEQADFFAAGTVGAKLVGLAMLVASMTGIASARNHLPGRVKAKLEAFEKADGEVSAVEVAK